MSIADLTLFKAYLGIADSENDALLQYALDSATRFIQQFTGRSFVAETAATKYFTPYEPDALDLGFDLRATTNADVAISVDTAGDLTFSQALLATDFILKPLMPFPDAGIYSRIEIAPLSSAAFIWGASTQVRIVGNWGYVVNNDAPIDVKQACLIQASRLYQRKDAPFGILQTTDLGQFTRIGTEDQDVMALLTPYKGAGQAWVIV